MKTIIISFILAFALLASCNSTSDEKKESKVPDTSVDQQAKTAASGTSKNMENMNPLSGILVSYLQMKNAFALDNDKDASIAGNNMVKAFANFNTTGLTTAQSKKYNDIRDDAKEHAEHIGMNAGNIKHQREHFEMLSKDVYELVKSMGAGQKLYYDHCPMYNGGKEANWISETKEINNPYLGKSMPTCGTVTEEIK